MPLVDPQLDNRTFEQLYTELRRRIPAYTPDWTDHNESDPGIVMMQLFCWLQEMQIWRINQVPTKNYVKFLEYIAQDLRPATAATAELKFTLSSKTPNTTVHVPGGTRVRSTASDAGPVVFETDSDLSAMPGDIVQVQVFDGGSFTVISQDQIASHTAFAPFSKQPQAGAALLLGFDLPLPPASATPHQLTVHAVRADGAVIVPVDSTIGNVIRPANVIWEYYSGDPTNWTPLPNLEDTTLALTQPGTVKFTIDDNQKPAHVAAQMGALQRPGDPALYWVRCRIDSLLGSGFQSLPMIEDVATNSVSATDAVTQSDELLGASSGLPGQTFTLSGTPVLSGLPPTGGTADSSQPGFILVDEGSGYVAWTQVDDFEASSTTDTHYTLNSSTGLVKFGDGKQGKIPALITQPSGSIDLTANIKTGTYRYGGGAAGNSGPDTITTLDDAVLGVQSVTNPRPSVGGADEETLDEAKVRLPKSLRTQYRAMTATDFADMATSTPGVQIMRAYALSQFHPTLSVARAKTNAAKSFVPFPGVITVFIVPFTTADDRRPTPSIEVCNLVAKQLDDKRLITTEVYVTGPTYRSVQVESTIIVDPSKTLKSVEDAVTNALFAYFNPISGGENNQGWQLGDPVSNTEAQRQILIVPGVLRIQSGTFKLYVDGVEATDDVQLAVNEIVCSDDHQIGATYG